MFAMPLAVVLFKAGRTAEAYEMKTIAIDGGLPSLYVAILHAMFGENDEALAALDRGYEERGDWMYTIGVQAWFRELRSHPRFVALVKKIKLGGGR
jgi:hypothetical protein